MKKAFRFLTSGLGGFSILTVLYACGIYYILQAYTYPLWIGLGVAMLLSLATILTLEALRK